VNDDRTRLEAAVTELEGITERLAQDDLAKDELKALAERALSASAQVTELLPRIIREIERASEGSTPDGAPEPHKS
jgi:ABC-type transporter Mla subunit MlaD